MVSIADQAAHHRLGWLNPRLYHLHAANTGIIDVTIGNNSFAGVAGFSAGPGYDLASGLGTLDAARFVDTLSHDRNDTGGNDGAGDLIPRLTPGN